jgi:ubiquinone/menaquinone biosynthesis C-methylase UbiE
MQTRRRKKNMTSISFDPMAHAYDAIRGYPHEVSRHIAEAIDQAAQANAQTRFLEVGVGTGRVAFPLTERGRQYTGIDISEKMLSRLEEKLRAAHWREVVQEWGSMPEEDAARQLDVQRFVHEGKPGAVRLVKSDMTAIPFHDASFDAVIAVHVFHLVSEWQQALQEIMRVLRPGGLFIRYWNDRWEEHWKPGQGDIRRVWSAIVEELGGSTRMPGVTDQEVTDWLQASSYETEQRELLTWQQEITPRTHFESVIHYQATSPWSVPDDLFAVSLQRLQQWMNEHYETTVNEKFIETERLILSRTRKPS